MQEDKVDSIVLGCAGMADLCEAIGRELGITVIDGVTVAVKLVESLVQLGLHVGGHILRPQLAERGPVVHVPVDAEMTGHAAVEARDVLETVINRVFGQGKLLDANRRREGIKDRPVANAVVPFPALLGGELGVAVEVGRHFLQVIFGLGELVLGSLLGLLLLLQLRIGALQLCLGILQFILKLGYLLLKLRCRLCHALAGALARCIVAQIHRNIPEAHDRIIIRLDALIPGFPIGLVEEQPLELSL